MGGGEVVGARKFCGRQVLFTQFLRILILWSGRGGTDGTKKINCIFFLDVTPTCCDHLFEPSGETVDHVLERFLVESLPFLDGVL
jgi:hypothetical protein